MFGVSLPVLTHYLSTRLPNMILLDSPISQCPRACLPGLGKGESETFQSLYSKGQPRLQDLLQVMRVRAAMPCTTVYRKYCVQEGGLGLGVGISSEWTWVRFSLAVCLGHVELQSLCFRSHPPLSPSLFCAIHTGTDSLGSLTGFTLMPPERLVVGLHDLSGTFHPPNF